MNTGMLTTRKDNTLLLAVLVVALGIVTGCAPNGRSGSASVLIDEKRANEIAYKEGGRIYVGRAFEIVSVTHYKEEKCWSLLIRPIPAVPDSFVRIEISDHDGHVIRE